MDIQLAKQNQAEAQIRLDRQDQDPQTRSNSTGAFSARYWAKVVDLLESGVAIPSNTTERQIVETSAILIKQGYVHCCDHGNPYGYQALIRVDWIGLTESEIQARRWVELASKIVAFTANSHEAVNRIRHELTPYDSWRKAGMDYFAAFLKANLTIAERMPDLRQAVLEQIQHKRKELEND